MAPERLLASCVHTCVTPCEDPTHGWCHKEKKNRTNKTTHPCLKGTTATMKHRNHIEHAFLSPHCYEDSDGRVRGAGTKTSLSLLTSEAARPGMMTQEVVVKSKQMCRRLLGDHPRNQIKGLEFITCELSFLPQLSPERSKGEKKRMRKNGT